MTILEEVKFSLLALEIELHFRWNVPTQKVKNNTLDTIKINRKKEKDGATVVTLSEILVIHTLSLDGRMGGTIHGKS